MFRFIIASLLPLPFLVLAAFFGGIFSWIALIWITVVTAILDRVLPPHWGNASPTGWDHPAEELSSILAGLHYALMLLALAALPAQSGLSLLAAICAFGCWVGQVSHPNAHELIHRPDAMMRRLGRLVYATFLFGHHASAHPKVHHIHVATPADPNSAHMGESFWRYLPRAWKGSFREGLKAERRYLEQTEGAPWENPYVTYVGVGLAVCFLALAMGGLKGLVIYLCICALAQMQLLQADYVQHYGLERRKLPNGKYEPNGPQHSWNAPQAASSAMMMNAPRHSDHHMHPQRIYPGLQLDPDTMPVLPRSLPVMAALALWPRAWRRVMDPAVKDWQKRQAATAPTLGPDAEPTA